MPDRILLTSAVPWSSEPVEVRQGEVQVLSIPVDPSKWFFLDLEFRDAEGTPLQEIRLTITSKAERFNWREAFSIRNPLTALKLEPRRKGYTILAQAYGYRDALIEVGHIESGTRKEFTITMEP